jgi:diaminopimelate epimerase
MTPFNPIFFKYHGNGNDFIIFDTTSRGVESYKQDIIKQTPQLCDRYGGIGADGVIVLEQRENRFRMMVINADGTPANNCGNGLRCVAAYLFKHHESLSQLTIELGQNLYLCERSEDKITVTMGDCHIAMLGDVFLESCQSYAKMAYGSLGNEHLIAFLDRSFDNLLIVVQELKEKFIPYAGMNIGILFQDERKRFYSSVFEKGVGFTKSCGSGASAAASFLAMMDDNNVNPIIIKQPGGDIEVFVTVYTRTNNSGVCKVRQRGPATEVFRGICEVLQSW